MNRFLLAAAVIAALVGACVRQPYYAGPSPAHCHGQDWGCSNGCCCPSPWTSLGGGSACEACFNVNLCLPPQP